MSNKKRLEVLKIQIIDLQDEKKETYLAYLASVTCRTDQFPLLMLCLDCQ
jgi:hypothetical protein